MVRTNLNLLKTYLKSGPTSGTVGSTGVLQHLLGAQPEPSKLHVYLSKGFSESIETSFESPALTQTTDLPVPSHNFHFREHALIIWLVPPRRYRRVSSPIPPEDVGREESSLVGGEWEVSECKPFSSLLVSPRSSDVF